jgi:hexosaminidase
MYKIYLSLWLVGVAFSLSAQVICPVIPLPEKAEKREGTFTVNNEVRLVAKDITLAPIVHYLQKELLRTLNLSLVSDAQAKSKTIVLDLLKGSSAKNGSYTLEIKMDQVKITSRTQEGLFNGINSLLQLIKNKEKVAQGNYAIDCWTIEDEPLYQWRGLMLDESRHFFGKEKVKQILNWMAFYKLNRFHWHLTDQHGWRIEIKQYPKLTLVGGIGNFHNEYAAPTYYTQEDIKEIVAYAAERFITVIPEIDMPGHASAANKAYPEFSGGGSRNYPEFTFNPGYLPTYQYLTNILREVDVLFPSQMIHIGGDEVHFGNEKWKTDLNIKTLMEKEKLADLKAVENYFFKRMADSVLKLNNKILAWDEVAESALPAKETIVFWWRHDRPQQLQKALDKGFSVVICPRSPMYFDYVQDTSQVYGPDWKKFGTNSVENIYKFTVSKVPVKFPAAQQVLGIQANLWTERIHTPERLDYMLFPRIAALAEAAWTNDQEKDYKAFEGRLKAHLPLYKNDGLYYFDFISPRNTGEPKN